MKKLVKIAAVICLTLTLNSCFLFGGGKSKCGDCPSWSQNEKLPQQQVDLDEEKV